MNYKRLANRKLHVFLYRKKALLKFKKNLKRTKNESMAEHVTLRIGEAFIWENTPEGRTYWATLDDDFRKWLEQSDDECEDVEIDDVCEDVEIANEALRTFLEQKGMYLKFKRNIKECSLLWDGYTVRDIMRSTTLNIANAFVWDVSNEGRAVWYSLNALWKLQNKVEVL